MDGFINNELPKQNTKLLISPKYKDESTQKRTSFYIQMIMISTFSLITIGLAFILSSTYTLSLSRFGNPFSLFLKQLFWVGIGTILMYIFTKIDTSLYSKLVKFLLILGIIVGILPFIPGIGKAKGEALRWINLGFLTISSSEVIKVITIIYISVVLSRKKEKKNFLNVFLPLFIIVTLFFILVSLQLDLSMAFLILTVSIILMFVGGVPLTQILLTVIVSSIFIFLFLGEKFTYLQSRITGFLDPWSDPFGKGYHYIYMIKSFQSGLLGKGIGNGIIKDKYLPEPHTDSIFAVISEETGLLGSITVIILIVILFYYSLKLASEINDNYKSLLIIGFSSTIAIWGLVNILVNIGLMPPTGTNLPLISYGGANMITSLIGIGIIYRCYREFTNKNNFKQNI